VHFVVLFYNSHQVKLRMQVAVRLSLKKLLQPMKEIYLQYPQLKSIEYGTEESIPSAGSVFIQRRNKSSDAFILLLLSLK